MLRKIERDERRPSIQLAELLADQLVLEDYQRESFLKMARGQFVPLREVPAKTNEALAADLSEFAKQPEEQAPFVARERQLQLLSEHLRRAMEGQGRMVFIAGEAGRGKTSLLLEFARQAEPDRRRRRQRRLHRPGRPAPAVPRHLSPVSRGSRKCRHAGDHQP